MLLGVRLEIPVKLCIVHCCFCCFCSEHTFYLRCRKGASVDDKLSDFFMKDINKVRVISMDAKTTKDARYTLTDDLGRTFYAQLEQLRY